MGIFGLERCHCLFCQLLGLSSIRSSIHTQNQVFFKQPLLFFSIMFWGWGIWCLYLGTATCVIHAVLFSCRKEKVGQHRRGLVVLPHCCSPLCRLRSEKVLLINKSVVHGLAFTEASVHDVTIISVNLWANWKIYLSSPFFFFLVSSRSGSKMQRQYCKGKSRGLNLNLYATVFFFCFYHNYNVLCNRLYRC